ncbi:stress response translation initiation inhibitor YciH [Marinibactrum halimedae]|uniref:Translation initiation factor n=1 Tax=Marinibactrum halimedae TaxID=1444977 RepID=A0AA37WPL2_9GAMM|nr:stress response translation initiation inhibitor YciH [Marinibactrum halimedae]MCD9457957.1 stress response translation initiation inhibitor YciH [Marinibactrum halimedae]GLS26212.1 translation initiation factor [Marinibactrum halimedae]
MTRESRLVYSTETGRIKPNDSPPKTTTSSGDGIVRIHRETKGRKGKGVSLITGIEGQDLKAIAKKLKQACGVGGSVKDDVIEIQTDQREKLKVELEKMHFSVKIAGG